MSTATAPGAGPGTEIGAFVRQVRYEARGVLSFRLERRDGGDMPEWTPGAHVDIALPSGLRRQYSLCGDPLDASGYRIAVRLVPDGRGGSRQMHLLRPGDDVTVVAVRNQFELLPASSYLFLAAGIGVTPLLPMLRAAAERRVPASFLYLGRSADQMAFAAELAQQEGVTLVQTDRAGVPDAADLIAGCTAERIYACGPAALLDDLDDAARRLDTGQSLHIERFAPVRPAATAAAEGDDKKILCARSGITVAVEAGETYLSCLRRAGIEVPSSCEMGICGTCEVSVTAGEPDHQDLLLTDRERAAGAFLPCVSRSRSAELTIDL